MEKVWRPKFEPKLILKLGFLLFSHVWFISLPLNCRDDTSEQCLPISSRSKVHKKLWEPKFGPSGPKSGPNLDFLPFSQVCFISFPGNCIG